MKNLQNSFQFLFLAFSLSLVFSCGSEDDDILPEPDLSIVEDETEINRAYEDLDYITLTAVENGGFDARIMQDIPLSEICDGVVATLDENAKTLTIDFGDGCTSSNGITRSGSVVLTYTGNLLFPGSSVVTTFIDYKVNEILVEGTRTITNSGINLSTGSISLAVEIENGKITWPDESFATISSDQVRQVSLTGDEYQASVTGSGEGVSREGVPYDTNIVDPLIFTQSCLESGVWVPNSGVLAFRYQNTDVSVDYGLGNCDKLITINYPGGIKEITLD